MNLYTAVIVLHDIWYVVLVIDVSVLFVLVYDFHFWFVVVVCIAAAIVNSCLGMIVCVSSSCIPVSHELFDYLLQYYHSLIAACQY